MLIKMNHSAENPPQLHIKRFGWTQNDRLMASKTSFLYGSQISSGQCYGRNQQWTELFTQDISDTHGWTLNDHSRCRERMLNRGDEGITDNKIKHYNLRSLVWWSVSKWSGIIFAHHWRSNLIRYEYSRYGPNCAESAEEKGAWKNLWCRRIYAARPTESESRFSPSSFKSFKTIQVSKCYSRDVNARSFFASIVRSKRISMRGIPTHYRKISTPPPPPLKDYWLLSGKRLFFSAIFEFPPPTFTQKSRSSGKKCVRKMMPTRFSCPPRY